MQSVIYFDICAIAILSVGILMFYMKKNIPNLHNKIFILMMWLILGASVCNLVRGMGLNGILELDEWMLQMVVYAYLIFYCAIPVLFLFYNLVITERIYKIKRQVFGYVLLVPAVIMYIIIAINPYSDILFSVAEDGQFTIGPGMVYVYIQSVFYYIVAVIYIQLYNGLFNLYKRISLYAFAIIIMLSSAIQIFEPGLLVESFGRALSMVVLDRKSVV